MKNIKPRSLFFRDKKVVFEKKRLQSLKDNQKQTVERINEMAEDYNNQTKDVVNPNEWFEKMPISNLKELYQFLNGKPKTVTLIMSLRSKIRKKHIQDLEILTKLNSDIYIANLDLLLSKIDCIQEKIKKD